MHEFETALFTIQCVHAPVRALWSRLALISRSNVSDPMPPPPTSLHAALRESALSAGIDYAAHLHSSLTKLTVTMCVVTIDTLVYRWKLSHDNGSIISYVLFGGRQGEANISTAVVALATTAGRLLYCPRLCVPHTQYWKRYVARARTRSPWLAVEHALSLYAIL